MVSVQSTNHRLVLIDMNLARNVSITDILCQEGVWLVVFCALRLRLSCLLYIQRLTSTR